MDRSTAIVRKGAVSFSPFDHHMMSIALTLARRGLGTTAPNPSVGAVIADEATGEVIARGLTQPGGRPHAETQALERAGDTRARAQRSTSRSSLAAHHGKTPPCADAVIAAGIRRVVIGRAIPIRAWRATGLRVSRAAGVVVETGLLSGRGGLGDARAHPARDAAAAVRAAQDGALGRGPRSARQGWRRRSLSRARKRAPRAI